jgi:hypothetical protein
VQRANRYDFVRLYQGTILRDSTLRSQLKLNERQFRELVRCPIGYEEYVEILKAKGYIGDA